MWKGRRGFRINDLTSERSFVDRKLVESGLITETEEDAPAETAAGELEVEVSAVDPELEKAEKEKAERFKKETGENGERMVEVIKVLLEREDIPKGLKDFGAKGDPKLSRLRIDIRRNLSTFLDWALEGILVVKKDENIHNSFFPLDLLYGVVNADVEGELGKEIEEKLKPLFEERVKLLNLALKENKYKENPMEWYHPRTGDLIDDNRETVKGSEYNEKIGFARIIAVTRPGRKQKYRSGEEWNEMSKSYAEVIVGTGR